MMGEGSDLGKKDSEVSLRIKHQGQEVHLSETLQKWSCWMKVFQGWNLSHLIAQVMSLSNCPRENPLSGERGEHL